MNVRLLRSRLLHRCILTVFCLLPLCCRAEESTYDIVIAGGRVIDGTGAAWFLADVGIVGDRIVAVGNLKGAQALKRIDATGLVVAPGFIDMQGQSEFTVLVDNRAASKITQGVTTEITGEGTSIAPVNDRMAAQMQARYTHYGVELDWRSLRQYFEHLERDRPAINLGTFVGAGGIRNFVIGMQDRPASPAELDEMRQLVAQAMLEGALGLSTALQYTPDRFASTQEVIELAKVVASYGGIYITHQRSEGDRILESLDEVFSISEQAKIPTVIWHFKTVYPQNWGKMKEALARLEQARSRGLDVTASTYPYTRAWNELHACMPNWVREGGTEAMVARLRDPAQRARIKNEMADRNATWENQWYGSGGGDGVTLISVLNPELRHFEGMTLTEIGRRMGEDPRDALMDLVIADRGESEAVIAAMNEDEMRTVNVSPLVSFGSDAWAQAEDGPLAESKTHPRAFGCFPRVLAKYVRDEHAFTWEEAIRKMTSLPARQVGLMDRGILRPGMFADITIFDPAAVRDIATYADPIHYSVGIKHVFVNGRPVVMDGKITNERPGRPLRGAGYHSQH
jgi:N-acyl-D-amino-acid deacylase